MKKELLSLTLALTICLSLTVSVSADSPKSNFIDVADNAYYATAVAWAVQSKITSGTSATTFNPDQTCTTAQVITFLWRSQNQPESSIQNPYSDVKSSDYYYKAALWAHEKGLVNSTKFNGSTPCTRSATVTYLWRLAGSPSAPSVNFTDVPNNASYAKAVAWAVSKGITSGTTATTFSPNASSTRGQIVTFLYRDLADATSDGHGLAHYSLEPTAVLNKEYPYTTPCQDNKSITTTGTVKFTDYTRKSLGNGYDELSINVIYTFSDDAAYEFGYSCRGGAVDYYLYTIGEETKDSIYDGTTINWNGKTYTECNDKQEIIAGGWDGDIGVVKANCTAKIPTGYDGFVVMAYVIPPDVTDSDHILLSEYDNLIMFRCA